MHDRSARSLVELDAVRGGAALVVFSSHFFSVFLSPLHDRLRATLLFGVLNGPAAVMIFFVLSGFVLALRPLRNGRPACLVGPVLRRWPRLAGPVVVAALAYVVAARIGAFPDPGVLAPSLGPAPPPSLFWGHVLGDGDAAAVLNEALVGTFLYGSAAHNPVLWTMKWELVGSLVVFGLVAIAVTPAPRLLRLSAFSGLAAWACWYSPWLVGFPFGAMAAWAHVRLEPRPVMPRWSAASLLAAAALLLSWDIRMADGPWRWATRMSFGQAIHVWGVAETGAGLAVMAAALYCRPLRRVLRTPLAAMLGRLSFPFYLIHLLTMLSFAAWAYVLLFPAGLGSAAGLLLFAATAVVSSAVAWPFMRFDEWWVTSLSALTRRMGVMRPHGRLT